MTEKKRRRVPRGGNMFPNRPPLSPEEKARRDALDEEFDRRCAEIFQQVYPELVSEHYNWSIMIDPNSGDYCIDPDSEIAFQKIRSQHPNGRIMEMRLNETGAVGRI